MSFQLINLDEIYADDDFNCRGAFSKVDVTDLAKDIEERTFSMPDQHGLINPIILRPLDATRMLATSCKYSLVAGFRRYFAFKVLKRAVIPATIISTLNDVDASILNLSENLARKDLTLLQESKSLARLKAMGISMGEVGKQLGKSTTWVQARYNLLELPEDIQNEAHVGSINQFHVKQLFSLKRRGHIEQMYEAVRKIKDAKINNQRKADVEIIVKSKEKYDTKKVRKRSDIFDLIKYFGTTIGMGLHSRVLSWAAGEISNQELDEDIKDYATENQTKYLPRQYD